MGQQCYQYVTRLYHLTAVYDFSRDCGRRNNRRSDNVIVELNILTDVRPSDALSLYNTVNYSASLYMAA